MHGQPIIKTDTEAAQCKTWCYQVLKLYNLFCILLLELMYCLIKYMLLLSIPNAWVTQHRFVECGPKQRDKRSNINLLFKYTTCFGG